MGRLQTPNIVRYHQSGMAWTQDVCWIVMEYIDGDALDVILEKPENIFTESQAIQVGG